MKREEKGWREFVEKRRGTNGFITCQGLADGSAPPHAVPNAAGGEGWSRGPLHRMRQLTLTQITVATVDGFEHKE
jgi:hypothetical protein